VGKFSKGKDGMVSTGVWCYLGSISKGHTLCWVRFGRCVKEGLCDLIELLLCVVYLRKKVSNIISIGGVIWILCELGMGGGNMGRAEVLASMIRGYGWHTMNWRRLVVPMHVPSGRRLASPRSGRMRIHQKMYNENGDQEEA
jgi:hypothetical protein